MRKNKNIYQNTKVIKDFFDIYGEDTAKEMSKFLFELQGTFFARPGINLSDEYKSECVVKFESLFYLATELQPEK